jgi:hypothetical protein
LKHRGSAVPYNRGMTEIDILVPFGLPPAELAADLSKELDTPALALLTARATSADRAARHETIDGFHRALPHEIWLARRFGFEDALESSGSPPIAAPLMQALGLAPEPGAWFVLQPVHIHIARDHLVLTDPRQLALEEQDARTLFDIAAPLFAETGKRILYGDAGTWFVHADDWSGLQTSSPDAAGGHNIDIWMPKGREERNWRRVQNDVQMHWFNHPVNEAREARGLKPVNSVWLWGGPSSNEHQLSPRYDKVFNLCGWMEAFGQFAPQHDNVIDTTNLLPALGKRNLLILDSVLEPALSNDWARWLEHMRQLEHNWFAPLLQALKSGALDHVSLILTHDSRISRFAATRSSLRKFWVKPTLATLCP